MLDHMHDLPLHSEHKEDDEVDEEYRPEDRDVKHREEGHHKADDDGFYTRQPELELGQSSHKGLVLIARGCG